MVNKTLRQIRDFVFALYVSGCAKMSYFMPNNRHLREVLVFFLNLKKKWSSGVSGGGIAR